MNVDLAVQIAIRGRLIATPEVTDLVPGNHILDRNHRPALRPGIIIGDAQIVDEGDALDRTRHRVFHTLHIWTTEPSTEINKQIAAAVRDALRSGRLDLGAGLHAIDQNVTSARTLRDPDGETAHGVMTLSVLVQEVE